MTNLSVTDILSENVSLTYKQTGVTLMRYLLLLKGKSFKMYGRSRESTIVPAMQSLLKAKGTYYLDIQKTLLKV